MWRRIKTALGVAEPELTAVSHDYEPIGEDDGQVPPHVDAALAGTKDGPTTIYWCFWVLGAGVLLAWNVLICTFPLLSSFFPEDSGLRSSLASWLGTVFCFGNLFFLGIAQKQVGKVSPSPRLHKALLLLLVVSLAITFPLLPFVYPALASGPLLFPLLLVTTLLLSIGTSYLQSSVFALAALWGSTEIVGVMSGQGGIAVLISGVQVVLAVVSALNSSEEQVGSGTLSSLAGVGLWLVCALAAIVCMLAHGHLMRHPEYTAALAPFIHRREEVEAHERPDEKWLDSTKKVFKKNIQLNVAVAWVFVVTLAVFPPITSRIVSVSNPPKVLLSTGVFVPLHFLIFNVGDYLGRTYMAQMPSLRTTSHTRALLFSFARTIFIPLFLLCNVTPRPSTLTPFINSDTLYFLVVLVFGLTNGWIGSLCMVLASSPQLNPRINDDEKDVAGTLAAFCLTAGLAIGSLCSFAVNWIVSGSVLS